MTFAPQPPGWTDIGVMFSASEMASPEGWPPEIPLCMGGFQRLYTPVSYGGLLGGLWTREGGDGRVRLARIVGAIKAHGIEAVRFVYLTAGNDALTAYVAACNAPHEPHTPGP